MESTEGHKTKHAKLVGLSELPALILSQNQATVPNGTPTLWVIIEVYLSRF